MALPQSYELLRLRNQAIAFGLACVKARIGHLGSGKEQIIFEIRDSLIYRAWSVQWHVNYLERQYQAFEKQLQGDITEALDSPQLLFNHRQILSYIFDDVVFNSVSMFDYVGNLVGLAYLGTKKSRLKWNGALNSSRDKSNPIHIAPVAEKLLTAHRNWVDPLMNYRGDTIHHKIDLAKANHRFGFSDGKLDAELNVHVPSSLTNTVFRNEGELNLIDGSARIAETSAKYCNEILACMETTLRPAYW